MQDMTWPEVKDVLEEAKLAILPVGSLEQHGPHLALSVAKLRRDLGVRMAYTLWPLIGGFAVAGEAKGRRVGHACLFETSLMMYLRPDLVRKDALVEGEMQEPLYGDAPTGGIEGFVFWEELTANGAFQGAPEATPEIGRRMTEVALEQVARFVRRFAEVPLND